MAKESREWLIAARKSKNLTQEEIADKLAITRTAYARYENAERTPTPAIASEIENILGVKKEYFFWPPQ